MSSYYISSLLRWNQPIRTFSDSLWSLQLRSRNKGWFWRHSISSGRYIIILYTSSVPSMCRRTVRPSARHTAYDSDPLHSMTSPLIRVRCSRMDTIEKSRTYNYPQNPQLGSNVGECVHHAESSGSPACACMMLLGRITSSKERGCLPISNSAGGSLSKCEVSICILEKELGHTFFTRTSSHLHWSHSASRDPDV